MDIINAIETDIEHVKEILLKLMYSEVQNLRSIFAFCRKHYRDRI